MICISCPKDRGAPWSWQLPNLSIETLISILVWKSVSWGTWFRWKKACIDSAPYLATPSGWVGWGFPIFGFRNYINLPRRHMPRLWSYEGTRHMRPRLPFAGYRKSITRNRFGYAENYHLLEGKMYQCWGIPLKIAVDHRNVIRDIAPCIST